MRIAILGTGGVGRTLATRLCELGHDVVIGTRDPAETTARRLDDGQTFAEWMDAQLRTATLETFHDAVTSGVDLVVNATNGLGTLETLALIGFDALDGQVLLDVSNPLDFSHGFPPRLSVKDDDSLAEQIQRARPRARVVKSLNTMTADVMVHPEALPEPTTTFVSGDDADAKALVAALLGELGHRDVIDLGDLSTARGTEMYLALWTRTMSALGTAQFNVRVVR